MSSGRDKFHRYKSIINFISKLCSFLPRSVNTYFFCFFSNTNGYKGIFFRYIFLKNISKTLGDNVYIGKYIVIKNPHNLSIGDNVSIHEYSYIDAIGEIIIENDVSIAHCCSLISFEHSFEKNDIPIKYQPLVFKKIIIRNNVWVGCGVRVLGGSTISERIVIGANSVVKNDLVSHGVYIGAPAKLVKKI